MRVLAAAACACLLPALGVASAKVGPIPVVATPGGVWAGAPAGGLVRLDATTARVLGGAPDTGVPVAVAAARGRVWALDARGRRALRISAAGSIEAARRLPGFPGGLAAGGTSLWALVYEGPRTGTVLLRLDPGSLAIRGRFHLGGRSAHVGAGGGRVWLALDEVSPRGGAGLVAIDERRGALVLRRRLRGVVRGVSVGAGGVWVLTERPRGARLVRIDPATGARGRIVAMPAHVSRLATGRGRVWVATRCGGPRCRLDRAAVRGYDADGRLVAGPFLPWRPCVRRSPRVSQLFLTDLAAMPHGAVATTGDGRGRVRVAMISERRGVRACPPA